MADMVRVSIPSKDGEMRPLALLEEDHAVQYIMDISSIHFSEQVEANLDKLAKQLLATPNSPTISDKYRNLLSFKQDLDNAVFNEGFRISNF